MAAAQLTAGPHTITLGAGTFVEGATVTIEDHLTIQGAGSRSATILSGGGVRTVFEVLNTGSLTLRNLTIEDASSAADGGAIISGGGLVVEDVHFRRNAASQRGGAIYHDGGALTVRDSLFEANNAGAAGSGGAIYADAGGAILIESTTFTGNMLGGSGGEGSALWLETTATVTDSLFMGRTDPSGIDGMDTVRMGGGVITRSALAYSGGWCALWGAADAPDNWWGLADGGGVNVPQEFLHYLSGPGSITVGSYLVAVDLNVTSTTPVVGTSVTATAVVDNDAGSPVVLPVRYTVSGTHGGTSTSSDTGHTYSGTSTGSDTVQARALFGDGTAVPVAPLQATATVTWGGGSPTPTPTPTSTATPTPDPDPVVTPVPTPTPRPNDPATVLTAQEKFDALHAAGIFGLGGNDESLPALLATSQVISLLTSTFLQVDAGLMDIGPSFPGLPGSEWTADFIGQASDDGLLAGTSGGLDPDFSAITISDLMPILIRVLGVEGDPLSLGFGEGEGRADEPLTNLGFTFAADFTGTVLGSTRLSLVGAGFQSAEDLASTDVDEPTLVFFEINAEAVPDGTMPEEITLARFDPSGPRWVAIETRAVRFPDGRHGLAAIIDKSGIYTVLIRPVEARSVSPGLSLVTWRGAEGQRPARALHRADAPIKALFRVGADGGWAVYRPGAPDFVQTLTSLKNGDPLVVLASGGGTWTLPIR